MRSWVALAAFLAAFGALSSRGAEEVIRGADHFSFSYRVVLPAMQGKARLWLPLARSDRFQDVAIERVSTNLVWRKVQDKSGLNEILVAEASGQDEGSSIEVDYTVTRREKPAYVDEAPVQAALRPDRLVPAGGEFVAVGQRVLEGRKPGVSPGRALYDHVLGRMRYDKAVQGYGRGDALFAAKSCAGNCTDFHAYFIAVARGVDIPARFAIGFTIPADRQEGRLEGYHCWAEFLSEGKWVPVDISEASKHPELADYYFGTQPANRFELSRGRDLLVDPAPESGPINFLVHPLLEVAGKPVPVQTEFTFQRLEP